MLLEEFQRHILSVACIDILFYARYIHTARSGWNYGKKDILSSVDAFDKFVCVITNDVWRGSKLELCSTMLHRIAGTYGFIANIFLLVTQVRLHI